MIYTLAFNSFKESLSADKISKIAERAIKKVDKRAKVNLVPIGDGGDGTMDALVFATNGKKVSVSTTDPLGKKINAEYGILGNGNTAVIEMAKASGLALLKKKKRNPLNSSTYGTGLLINDAIKNGAKDIIIGIGGSATNDGGIGVAKALGYKLLDKKGKSIEATGRGLLSLKSIVAPKKMPKVNVSIASDVDNPLYGPKGAAYIYARQKGADEEAVRILDDGLRNFASVCKKDLGKDISTLKGAGAAGGLGAGLVVFLNGKLKSGVDLVLKASDLEKYVMQSDVVFTGEGAVDEQTAYGKAPAGVARLCKKHKKKCILLAGGVKPGSEALHKKGVTAMFSLVPAPISLNDAMTNAEEYVLRAVEEITRLLVV